MFCLSIAKTKAGNSSARRSFLATASLTSARTVEKCRCLSAAKMYHLGTAKAIVECDSTRPHKIHQTIRRFRPTLPGKNLVEMSRSYSQIYRRSWYCIFNDRGLNWLQAPEFIRGSKQNFSLISSPQIHPPGKIQNPKSKIQNRNDVMLTGQTQRYASPPNKVSDRNTLQACEFQIESPH